MASSRLMSSNDRTRRIASTVIVTVQVRPRVSLNVYMKSSEWRDERREPKHKRQPSESSLALVSGLSPLVRLRRHHPLGWVIAVGRLGGHADLDRLFERFRPAEVGDRHRRSQPLRSRSRDRTIKDGELDGAVGQERGANGGEVVIGSVPDHLEFEAAVFECGNRGSPASVTTRTPWPTSPRTSPCRSSAR